MEWTIHDIPAQQCVRLVLANIEHEQHAARHVETRCPRDQREPHHNAAIVVEAVAAGTSSARNARGTGAESVFTDRFGADYAAFPASVEECRRRCTVDGRCKAFTFRRSAPW